MKKNSKKKAARRVPTKFPCIYKQTGKELYDVRYNYKETDLVTGEVRYKNKWVYGLASLEIARSTLLQLQTGSIGDGDITLAEAFELWLRNAEIRQYKDVSVQNTTGHIRMIYCYVQAKNNQKLPPKFTSSCNEGFTSFFFAARCQFFLQIFCTIRFADNFDDMAVMK